MGLPRVAGSWASRHREHYRATQRKYHKAWTAALWAELLEAYGGKCKCCGEAEPLFLTLDHINGDGAAHRKSLNQPRAGGRRIWAAVKAEGFPQDRYRLLCHNCNCGRARNGGVCPHTR